MRRIEKILLESEEIKDLEFAKDIYRNFCNQVWYDYITDDVISFSWRASGRFISEIRNKIFGNDKEDYMDFYCSDREGVVTENVKKFLNDNKIILFEKFYDSSILIKGDFNKTEKEFKKNCSERIQYLREINIDKILK